MSKSKTNLITAITISGKLTIAHYLFVLKPILAIKKNYNFFFSIADLHAITTKHVSNELIKLRQQTANYLFACGFPSNEIFVQSQISGHSKMAFILGCHTNIGTLLRMTQFKSKKNRNFQNLALLNYPLLMASDILLYDADVWVGNDQKQHVELTRDLAQKINNSFHQKIFYQPNLINNSFFNYRIRDLQKPTVKMSKSSQDPRGIIFFHDNSEIIKDKIIACKTDSENKIIFDFEKKPGISNLILLYAMSKNITIEKTVLILQKKCSNYFILKQMVAASIIEIITPIQKNVQNYQDDSKLVNKYLEEGRKRAQKQVDSKFKKIQKILGFNFIN